MVLTSPGPEEHFYAPGRHACIARGIQFIFAKSLKVLKFGGVFFGPPWNRANIKNNKINTHVRGIVVSKHLFLALCFYSDACFSLVWSEQQVSELRNLARERKLAWNHFVLSTKMPQALCEWYISTEVTLAEMLWPPPDCSQWHQALQAKRRHLGKITPLKLPAEELNLTPTNCCTIVTGINWIC